MNTPLISIVSPVYRADAIIPELVRQVTLAVKAITEDYEIILVNDASPDSSWEKILTECKKDPRVKGVNLSRNFGQHYAITAGLSLVHGEWIVVMDCDLQDRPEEIPRLYQKATEGYDIILAQRIMRHDRWMKRFTSAAFHKIFHYFSGIQTDKTIANFGIYSHKVIDAFNKMPEITRSFPSLISVLGFHTFRLPVTHGNRFAGTSSYSWAKLFKLGFDVTIANSNKPLHLAVELGLTMSFVAFIAAVYNVIAKLNGIISVPGFTTTVFSIWFVGGLILAVLGIVGLYVGKIFDQVKGRPLFVISEKVNCGDR